MKIWPTTPREKTRLAVLLFILFSLLPIAYFRVRSIFDATDRYASTISLGGGFGIIIYAKSYHTLRPELQAVVRVHEETHLQRGTWQFWRHNELECEAYDADIEFSERAKEKALEDFNRTHDIKYFKLYVDLTAFQQEAKFARAFYSKQLEVANGR